MDIQLQHGALCFNIRYGTTVEEEKNHVLEIARQRAVAQSGLRKQKAARRGRGIRGMDRGGETAVAINGECKVMMGICFVC